MSERVSLGLILGLHKSKHPFVFFLRTNTTFAAARESRFCGGVVSLVSP